MQELPIQQCEWAINSDLAIMLATPRFHQASVDGATLDGDFLVVRYDWFMRMKIRIPKFLSPNVVMASSILFVAFSESGDITEQELQVVRP